MHPTKREARRHAGIGASPTKDEWNPWRSLSYVLVVTLVVTLLWEYYAVSSLRRSVDQCERDSASGASAVFDDNEELGQKSKNDLEDTARERRQNAIANAAAAQLLESQTNVIDERPSVFAMMVRCRRDVGHALVTVQNIQSLGTKHKFHFFLLPMGDDHISEEEFFSEEFMRIFRKFDITPTILPEFPYPSDELKATLTYNNWHFALHRLSLFGMYDKYERLLLIDSDMVYVAPVDEVFKLTRTGVAMFPEPGQCVLPDKMCGGFVLIYPEEWDWKNMLEFAESVKDQRDPTWSNSEQTFLGFYFKADMNQMEHPHNVVSLSHIYTYPLHDCNCDKLTYEQKYDDWTFQNKLSDQLQIVKVYHFIPGFKPWRYSMDINGDIAWSDTDEKCIQPIVNLYAQHRKAMLAKLSDDEVYTLRLCRTVRDVDCTPEQATS